MIVERSGFGAAVLAACLTLAPAPSVASSGGGSNFFRNLFMYGGPTAPPSVPEASTGVVDCPSVAVIPGAAALRSYAGGRGESPEALRSQLAIVDVARECIGRPDGSIVVKVGVEGRALIGPAGSAGQLEAPVRFVIKRGDAVLANRSKRATVAIPQGGLQGTFTVVEDGLVVPPNTGDFDIEVGLGAGPAERPARKARRN
jgi:hypothetical protein